MNNRTENIPYSKYRGTILVLMLYVLQLVMIKFSTSVPSYHFLFLFFFFNLILVPGYFLSGFFFHRIEFPGRVLLAFVFGTAILFVFLLICALLRLDLFYVGIVVPVVSVVLSIIPRAHGETGIESLTAAVSGRDQVILLSLIIFVIVLIFAHGDPMLYTSDSAGQISYIRAVSMSHEAFPEQNLYKDGGSLTRDIRKGLMHSAWGTINLLTGRKDVYSIWSLISAICSVFTVLAFFCAGWFIFRSPAIGLLTAFIFVFIHAGGLTSYRLITTAYSFPIGRIFSIAFLFSILCFLERNKKEYLILMAAAAFAGTGTHIGILFVSAFIIFYTVGGKLIESSPPERKILIRTTLPLVVALTVGVNIPYLLMRYLRDYAPNNEIHTHLQGIFRITENLYTLNPVIFFLQSGILAAVSLISIFVLWKYSRYDESLRLLLWGNITLWLLLFNPVLFPLLMKLIAYLVMRLKTAVPASLLAAVLIKILWDRLRSRETKLSSMAASFGWIAVLGCFGYQLVVTPRNFAYSGKSAPVLRNSCLNITDLYDSINSLVPDGSVIVSDPITSYCIPAFTDQYVVCTNSQHSIPNDSTALERIGDCRNIFSSLSSMDDIAGVINKYGIEYIAVNGRVPLSIVTMYWKLNREVASETINRFNRYPQYFDNLYEDGSVALYRVAEGVGRGEVPAEGGDPLAEYIGEKVSFVDLSGLAHSGTDGIYIKSVRPDMHSVERGGRLTLDIEWVSDRELDYRSYMAHIRFDTDFEKGRLFHEYYGKIYRKILEKARGHRFRFRAGHLPFSGIFTPDQWPTMRIIKDKVVITVPEDIAPGEYIISLKLLKNTHYPNYSLKDLLMDEDSFDGPDMAKVIIK
jgi:hypothetical protein